MTGYPVADMLAAVLAVPRWWLAGDRVLTRTMLAGAVAFALVGTWFALLVDSMLMMSALVVILLISLVLAALDGAEAGR